MTIRDLTTVVLPPPVPVEKGNDELWTSVQKKLKISLPEDFRDLSSTYGSGSFVDEGKLHIFFYNPFSADFLQKVKIHCSVIQDLKKDEGGDYIPFKVFPKKGGMLVWGRDDNGNDLFWLAKGPPEKWPIIIRSNDGQLEQFEESTTGFLARIFTRQLSANVWPEPFFQDPIRIRFTPAQISSGRERELKNIYQLYVENGNNAGFWAWDPAWAPSEVIFVKTIGGLSCGPLKGKPIYYDKPAVVIDSYLEGKLFKKDETFRLGHIPAYSRIDAPFVSPNVNLVDSP